jgi:hypothetical protein
MIEWLKANALALVAAVVAIYGAVLSTLMYVHGKAEKRRTLKVSLKGGILNFGPDAGKYQCAVYVRNAGHLEVSLRSVYLTAGELSIHIPAENSEARRLPYILPAGKGRIFWIRATTVAAGLAEHGVSGMVEITAVAQDGTGREFQSSPISFDVSGLLLEP